MNIDWRLDENGTLVITADVLGAVIDALTDAHANGGVIEVAQATDAPIPLHVTLGTEDKDDFYYGGSGCPYGCDTLGNDCNGDCVNDDPFGAECLYGCHDVEDDCTGDCLSGQNYFDGRDVWDSYDYLFRTGQPLLIIDEVASLPDGWFDFLADNKAAIETSGAGYPRIGPSLGQPVAVPFDVSIDLNENFDADRLAEILGIPLVNSSR